MRSSSRLGSQTGVAVVEFVIAMPLLLFLMLATAELGRAFYQYTALEKAVENGARYLADFAENGTTGTVEVTDAQRTAVRNLVIYGNIQGGETPLVPALVAENVDVQVAADLAQHVRVTVSYPYQPIIPEFPILGWISQRVSIDNPLRAQVTMRALGSLP
jgi:Flp pilus assembly protein TadG